MIVCDGELERERSSAILALALGNGVTVTAGSMRDEEVFEARCGRGAAILVGKLELMDSRMIGHSMALPSVAERLLLERAYSALALAGISETPRGGYSILRE